ncbi:MAG: tRNA pseudouridine(13) synthase TruD [Candidatus Methanomethylicaceae archaeon]
MSVTPTISPLENSLGMRYYSTPITGIGGRIRQIPHDFLVEEITPEGLVVNDLLESLNRGGGPYTLAVLKKVSRDLLSTVLLLQKRLGAKISFAGIKDRRAVTYQLISITRPIPQTIKLNNLEVWAVGTSRWGMRPGELRGNRFTITIRDLGMGEVPPNILSYISWLPGYFGHQRFGTTRPNTHKIGRLIVKGDFDGAIREFLAEPYEGEPYRIYSVRKSLSETWNLESALTSFPDGLIYEKKLLQILISGEKDPVRALNTLPRRLLRLFVDAYQSYLFNLALSERWASHGLFSIDVGDFVAPLDASHNPSRPIHLIHSNMQKLQKMVNERRAALLLPVPGSALSIKGINEDLYFRIFDSERVSPEDFSNVMGLAFRGTLRPAVFYPRDCELLGISPDELNAGRIKITVRFSMPRGSYATVLLRELMKPKDPKGAGF